MCTTIFAYWIWLEKQKLRFGKGLMPGSGTILETVCALEGPPQTFVAFTARSADVEFFDVLVTDGSNPQVRVHSVNHPGLNLN